MTDSQSIQSQIGASRDAIAALAEQADAVAAVADLCVQALKAGQKILTCGNGGSSTDAMHLTEELVARYRSNRQALPSICLASDPSIMTCIANDFGWEEVFARQVEAHGQKGDVIVAFTTSGESENINRALRSARERGLTTIGLLGKTGGGSLDLCDQAIVAPGNDTPRIQEVHTLLLHIICEAVEKEFT